MIEDVELSGFSWFFAEFSLQKQKQQKTQNLLLLFCYSSATKDLSK